MRSIFLTIILSFNLFATNWYVDRDASGSPNNGTSWNNAWKHPNNIVWASIGAGDTIYVSGGTDSTVYTPISWNPGIGSHITLSNVVFCRAKDAGHNGEVWIVNTTGATYTFYQQERSGLEINGFVICSDSATEINSGTINGQYVSERDSFNVLTNCHIFSYGRTNAGIGGGYESSNRTYSHNYIEVRYNTFGSDCEPVQDGSLGGDIFEYNTIVHRSAHTDVSGTATDTSSTSLTDNTKNFATNYHRYTTLTATWNENSSYLIITSNTSTSLIGSGGWVGDGTPDIGATYVTSGGHRDAMQRYVTNPSRKLHTIYRYNVILFDSVYDASAINSALYSSSSSNVSYIYYRNIISVNAAYHSYGIAQTNEGASNNTMRLYNNTIITTGENQPYLTIFLSADTLIAKNNLFVSLGDNPSLFMVLANGDTEFANAYKDINYNYYYNASGSYSSSNFTKVGYGASYSFTTWKNIASSVGDSLDTRSYTGVISFPNLTLDDTTRANYITTAGRDVGYDLTNEIIPMPAYDILGNPVTDGLWDMGALEFIDAEPGSTTGGFARGSDYKYWFTPDGKLIRLR